MLAHDLISKSKELKGNYKTRKHALVAAAKFLSVEREKLRDSIHTSMTTEQAREQSENIAILKHEISGLKYRIKR